MSSAPPTDEAILLGYADPQKLEGLVISALMNYPEATYLAMHEAGFQEDWLVADRGMFSLVAESINARGGFDLVVFCTDGSGGTAFERAGGILRAHEISGAIFQTTSGISTGNFIGGLPIWLEGLRTAYVKRKTKELLAKLEGDPELITEISGELVKLATPPAASVSIESKLEERRFDFSVKPPRPRPILKLNGTTVSTPGNIDNFQAPPKTGKTAVVGGVIGAIFNGNRQGADTLGFSAENPEGHALIHFDTEQSPFDHDQIIRRALFRARRDEAPSWFYSYCVTDLTIPERLKALQIALEKGKGECGGVFAVIIDGVADLCLDPNDSAEAFDLVETLRAMAIGFDCAVLTVIHENPGSEFGKTRGHLGSHIERKAESNLRIAKDSDGVSTIWSQRNRHGDIPKEFGPRFCWSDEKGMHVSCESAKDEKAASVRGAMLDEAEDAFEGAAELSYTNLVEQIKEAFKLKERAAKERIKKWAAEGIIRKNQSGNYVRK